MEYIRQVDAKEIDEENFRELVNELDLERVMGESITDGPATMQATTQDEEAGESEQDESAVEAPAAAEKGIELSTIGKGKWKASPTRAKVYAAMDEPVSHLIKSTSICANVFAHSATDVSLGRQSRNESPPRTSNAARGVRQIRAAAFGGGGVGRSSRAKSPSLPRGPGGNW
jgi:hypothetical protein